MEPGVATRAMPRGINSSFVFKKLQIGYLQIKHVITGATPSRDLCVWRDTEPAAPVAKTDNASSFFRIYLKKSRALAFLQSHLLNAPVMKALECAPRTIKAYFAATNNTSQIRAKYQTHATSSRLLCFLILHCIMCLALAQSHVFRLSTITCCHRPCKSILHHRLVLQHEAHESLGFGNKRLLGRNKTPKRLANQSSSR